jgi:hypothetical protein
MDRETLLLLALGLLVVAALTVGACGWTLFARDRRSGRTAAIGSAHPGERGDA